LRRPDRVLHRKPSALSNLSFWVTSFPRRRETSATIWIPACAGMTVNPNFKTVNLNFKTVNLNFKL
jgi:hypothetical protein